MSSNGKWDNRIVGHGTKPADQFQAHPQNWRLHPQFQRDVVRGSLDELGWVNVVIENVRTGNLLDGHDRIFQALEHNEDVPYIQVDLSEEEEVKALVLLDSSSALARPDRDNLDALLAQVSTEDEALGTLLNSLADDGVRDLLDSLHVEIGGWHDYEADEPPGDPEAALNRAEELQAQYGVERGQLWIIGRHRLLCGDAYSEDDLARLLDGLQPNMLHIDPPYGISIIQPKNGSSAAAIGGAKPFGATSGAQRMTGAAFASSARHGDDVGRIGPANIVQSNYYPPIEGDDRPFDPAQFLTLAPIVIMWGANYFAHELPASSAWLCWDKREGITRNTFADCELAWTNMDKPARVFHHLWNGLHKGSQHGQRRTHPTEKPTALFEEIGKMYCPDGLWLDVFAGTGAQMVAAERVGATCYAMEVEPLYVATLIDRMERMGLRPARA